ncbi:hypothetical protein BH11MYX3_BH11MYX3_31470 [soil metagenome]
MKSFFVAALTSALDLRIATPEDVLRHVTPDVLAQHLPRPLWARLLTACVGAPKVDAQLVVETIGVSNLCEHIPSTIIWSCIAEVGARSLGGQLPAQTSPQALSSSSAAGPIKVTDLSNAPTTARSPIKPLSIGSPPPPESRPTPTPPPSNRGPSIPSPALAVGVDDVVAELEAESTTPPVRGRTPTNQRFRQTNTNIGRLAAANQQRRPQAQAAAPSQVDPPTEKPRTARRGETEIEVEVETDVGAQDWRTALAVEDEQLVDWSSSEETVTTSEADHAPRKR